jgi:3-hydroxybutyryl-CoA dehydrogenase
MGREIHRVSVVGTGTLGVQIAVLSAHFGYEVTAFDVDKEAFPRTFQSLRTRLEARAEKGILTVEQWISDAKKVNLSQDLNDALHNTDLVIEAISENIETKRKVFKDMDALAPERAILATNSSSIPISRIENATQRPEQCLNIHFYFPIMGINIVELMGGTKTAVEIFEAGERWIRSIGCVPIKVKKESFGFCFNRVWRTIKREVLHMWADGTVDFKDIDRAWMIFNGTEVGPFGLMDRVGLDVVYDIELIYFNESKDLKDFPPHAFKVKIENEELGVKTGKGFYVYPNPEYLNSDFLKS